MRSRGSGADHSNATRPPVVAKAIEFSCDALHARGLSWLEIAELLEEKVRQCRESARAEESIQGAHSYKTTWAASRIVYDWFRIPLYVSDSGAPRPLKLWGNADSVESLAALRAASTQDVRAAVECLVQMNGCRPLADGLYAPSNYTLMVANDREMMNSRGAHMVGCLVESMEHNLEESNKALREFERSAYVPRVRASDLPAFRHFMSAQGQAFIEIVDQWLEGHRAQTPEEHVEVIVEVFSHVTDAYGHVVGRAQQGMRRETDARSVEPGGHRAQANGSSSTERAEAR